MPFDSKGFKLPASVTVLPPTPPEEPGGGRRRVVVEIEITNKPPRKGMPMVGVVCTIILWLILFAVVIAAHSQPLRWPQEPQPNAWNGWPMGNTHSWQDSTGTTFTFPDDQNSDRGGGHGCKTYRGGDGFVRTECW